MGAVAIGLVAVFVVAGMFGGNFFGAAHSAPGPAAKTAPVTPAAKSVVSRAAVHPSAITVSSAFTSTFLAYNLLPLPVNFTITVTGAPISAATTTVLVNVSDYTVTSGYPNYIPTLITSTAIAPATGETNYYFNVSAATLLCAAVPGNNLGCTGLAQDEYGVSVFVGVASAGAHGTTNLSRTFFLITQTLQATLVSPVSTSAVAVGNVTLSVAYIGSWVAGAVINIINPTTGILIYSHLMVELTPGIPVSATWFAGQVGTFDYSIVMTTVYLPTTHYYNGTLTVITHGGTVFQNETKWTNSTIISGLSGAAAGTILLVVGLIVGMIVALVLARAVMGKPAQAPPQPWESKPGAGAAPNTCSVCGKSFSTPEELAAHGKSEHGMQ